MKDLYYVCSHLPGDAYRDTLESYQTYGAQP